MKTIEEQMYAELAEVKRQRDEYYDELLSKRQRIAELEAKLAQISEKACAWLKDNCRGLVSYNNASGGVTYPFIEAFSKAMEED